MIVERLWAENVLKYSLLDLRGLPGEGIIAISGGNESGKSSIGETLCFALFGRTFALGPGQLGHVIRWGADDCRAVLEFRVDGTRYRLERGLDDLGHHSARLERLEDAGVRPVAQGPAAVDAALRDTVGFDFDEYIDTFYLAQREITTPHPHSHSVRRMAGIDRLLAVDEELEQSILVGEDALDETREELEALEEELLEQPLDPAEAEARRSLREQLAPAREALRALGSTVAQMPDRYAALLRERQLALRAQTRLQALASLSLVLALALWAAWAVLVRWGDSAAGRAAAQAFADRLPGWEIMLPGLLPGALAFSALFLVLSAWSIHRGRQASRAAAGAEELVQALAGVPRADWVALDEQAGRYADVGEAELLRAVEAGVSTLSAQLGELRGTRARVEASVDELQPLVRALGERWDAALAALDAAIEEDEELRQQRERTEEVRVGLQQRLAEQEHRLQVETLARELIHGAARQLSQRFNRAVRDAVGRILPGFTEGRYEYLQLDDELQVRVFSREKQDFLDFDEISSGTQRQILLALRLALARELVETAGAGEQFLFLDEPFAFFDEERTAGALEALLRLAIELPQIWIVAQQFPAQAPVAMHLVCDRNQKGLSAEHAGGLPAEAIEAEIESGADGG